MSLSKEQTQTNNEVINAILAYTNKQREEATAHVEEQKMVMDAEAFFGENGGIMERGEFLNYLTSLGESEVLGFQQFLADISNSRKLTIPFFTRTGKSGSRYYWISQNTKTISRGYKVVWCEGIDKLIEAFQFGIYKFDLSLKALFTEATKQSEEAA